MKRYTQQTIHRPHVGFVTDSFLDSRGQLFEGGAERHLLHLASVAAGLGAEVTVYQRGLAGREETYQGIRVVGWSASPMTFGRQLARRALRDRCTHLHFQYLNQVPRIRSEVIVTATGHAVYWDLPYVDQYRSWYPGGRVAALLLPVWRWRERHRCLRAIVRCKRVLATDSSLLRLVQSDRPGLRNRVDVVPNFTDLLGGGSASAGVAADHPSLGELLAARARGSIVVLVPRNLSFVRGGAWLPEIVERSASLPAGRHCQFFLTGVPMNVYGAGHRYRSLFEGQLASMSKEARAQLHLLGGVPRASMQMAYDNCDIVLIPTFAHEGTSLAAVEAMGSGRPVIATNVGGLNDLIVDRVTGLLVPTDPDAIAAAVSELAQDSKLRARLGEEARRRVGATFSEVHWRRRAESFARRVGWARDPAAA